MAEKQVNNCKGLVVIGGSSGSLEALLVILPQLRSPFPLPIVIVVHRNNTPDNNLALVLSQKNHFIIKEADEKEWMQAGIIYLAPPDYHLLMEEDGSLSLDVSEKVNYSRPSIDVSFSSAAGVYKNKLIAVLLSGANADGAAGMVDVKNCGGINIIQDPADAQVPYMPEQALLQATIDHILPASEISDLLNKLAFDVAAN